MNFQTKKFPAVSKMIENRMRPLSTKEVEIPCYSCKKKNYGDLVNFGVPLIVMNVDFA